MRTHIIILTNSSNGTWCISADRVKAILADSILRLELSDRVELLLTSHMNPQQLSKLTSNDSRLCIICHLEPSTYGLVEQLAGHSCWIFVSGGRSYLPAQLKATLGNDSAIWFQGAYGRESNFEVWLDEWSASDFARHKFQDSSDVLLTGKSGAALIFEQFCYELLPLIIIFESFIHFSDSNSLKYLGAAKKETMYEWLSTTLREITLQENLFHALSSQATVLDGMLRNQKLLRDTPVRAKELQGLLSFFVPQFGAHAARYEPELDDDFKKLIGSKLDSSKIDECISKWLTRFRSICLFLHNEDTEGT